LICCQKSYSRNSCPRGLFYFYPKTIQNVVKKQLILKSLRYTHNTSRCKVSKANCTEMRGIKLKYSYSTERFYNKADWYNLPCPTGRELENQRCVAAIEKGITITSCCVLLWSPSLRLAKHLEVTWVYMQKFDEDDRSLIIFSLKFKYVLRIH